MSSQPARPEDGHERAPWVVALPLVLPLIEVFLRAWPEDDAGPPAVRALADAIALAAAPENVEPAWLGQARLGTAIIQDLPAIIDPRFAGAWLVLPGPGLPMTDLVRYWNQWARQARPAPVIAAIAAALLVSAREGGLLDPRCEPLAAALGSYVEGFAIRTWDEAREHAIAWWDAEASAQIWPLVVRTMAVWLEERR